MPKTAFAIACHPDDIEFLMAGTLILLKDAGYEIHYLNIANGSCGTAVHDRETIVRMRREEAIEAARLIGATYHESLVDDLDVFYDRRTAERVCAAIREVAPEILLTHSPSDYMEDHQNAGRLAVTAAFCRGMRNFISDPPRPPIAADVTVYHAQPHGNRDPLRRIVRAGLYVDVSSMIGRKRAMLACHRTQKEWLDTSQGMDSYLNAMEALTRETGQISGRFDFAEGWRRRNHLGFCAPGADPLRAALGERAWVDGDYEAGLGSSGRGLGVGGSGA